MAIRNENFKKISEELKFLSSKASNKILVVKFQYAAGNTREMAKKFHNRIKSLFEHVLLIVEGRHKRYLAELNIEM